MRSLFDVKNEKEACGVGFIVSIHGNSSHELLRSAQTISDRMEHRGACSCDNSTGDGAGVLTSIPHQFYQDELQQKHGIQLPPKGQYATGILFLDQQTHQQAEQQFESIADQNNLKVICWRDVPVDSSCIGQVAKSTEPLMRQPFVVSNGQLDLDEFKRKVNAMFLNYYLLNA